MATEHVRTVTPGGGGNYTSLAAWVAGETPKDLVASDEIYVAECYGGVDTGGIASFVSGWTCDETRYIHVRVHSSARTVNGKWSDRGYIRRNSVGSIDAFMILIGSEKVVIDGVQFDCVAETSTAIELSTIPAARVDVMNCFLRSATDCAVNMVMSTDEVGGAVDVVNIWNCIQIRGRHDPAWVAMCKFHTLTAGEIYIYGCTVKDTWKGTFFWNSTGFTCRVKNSIFIGQETSFSDSPLAASLCSAFIYSVENSVTDSVNISAGLTDLGGNHSNVSVTFVNAAADDLRLASNDVYAKVGGLDLSNDSHIATTTDIVGKPRLTHAWDVGAIQSTVAHRSPFPFSRPRQTYI